MIALAIAAAVVAASVDTSPTALAGYAARTCAGRGSATDYCIRRQGETWSLIQGVFDEANDVQRAAMNTALAESLHDGALDMTTALSKYQISQGFNPLDARSWDAPSPPRSDHPAWKRPTLTARQYCERLASEAGGVFAQSATFLEGCIRQELEARARLDASDN